MILCNIEKVNFENFYQPFTSYTKNKFLLLVVDRLYIKDLTYFLILQNALRVCKMFLLFPSRYFSKFLAWCIIIYSLYKSTIFIFKGYCFLHGMLQHLRSNLSLKLLLIWMGTGIFINKVVMFFGKRCIFAIECLFSLVRNPTLVKWMVFVTVFTRL